MFIRFFKRNSAVSATSEAPLVSTQKSTANAIGVEMRERRKFPRALPVPDVLEGDGGELDWALWSDAIEMLNKGDSTVKKNNPAG